MEINLLLRHIIEFYINDRYPKEFKNNYMNKFCINEEIKNIHGIPNNPHSQGVKRNISLHNKKIFN